jgi:hypothetical protein
MTTTSEKMKEARINDILTLLTGAEMTIADVAKHLRWTNITTWHYVGMLHEQCRLSIASWEVKSTCMNARYTTGCFPDVPKPARVKKEAQEDEAEVMWKVPPVIVNVRRDPFEVALFGEYRRAA